MKKLILFLITLYIPCLSVDYPADAPGENAVWERLYDTSTVDTITGRVRKIELQSSNGTDNEIRMIVTTQKDTETVLLGPIRLVKEKKVCIIPGDTVSIVGSRVNFRGKNVIIAAQISNKEKQYLFRNRKGLPVWNNR